MIKYLFILINSLGLFLYSLFSNDGGVTITNTIPANIKPGQEVAVEIKIAKGSLSGFAKMQIEVPEGFLVTDVDNKGSSFSFMDGIAKWVWASLPADNELLIKCKIKAGENASGVKTISGKYSYVENNAKQVVEMTPVEMTIGTGDAAISSTGNNSAATNTTQAVSQETPVATNTATESSQNTSTQNQSTGNNEPSSNIQMERTITRGSTGSDFTITVKINKGMTKGFARYSDDLPSTVTAKSNKTEGASFSVADGKVKFVWVAVPEKETLEISYTVIGVKKMVLYGEYSYLEQNQSKKAVLSPETIEAGEPVANNTATQTTVDNNAANTNTSVAQNDNSSSQANNNSGNTTNSQDNSSSQQNQNSQGNEVGTQRSGNVNYMVQIGAFTNGNVTASRLANKFNISEKINSEMQGGYSKFMVGDHQEYKNARDHREKVRNNNGVASAFVVAYNSGRRITVQEALMVSNQKWFK